MATRLQYYIASETHTLDSHIFQLYHKTHIQPTERQTEHRAAAARSGPKMIINRGTDPLAG